MLYKLSTLFSHADVVIDDSAAHMQYKAYIDDLVFYYCCGGWFNIGMNNHKNNFTWTNVALTFIKSLWLVYYWCTYKI